jgi:hypothetical protein
MEYWKMAVDDQVITARRRDADHDFVLTERHKGSPVRSRRSHPGFLV